MTSSRSTSVRGDSPPVGRSMRWSRPISFLTCAEKLDRSLVRSCASPMSAKVSSKNAISDPSLHGRWSPHRTIRLLSPNNFSSTVLPPVLGPEITNTAESLSNMTSFGTTCSLLNSSKGWRAFHRRTCPSGLSRTGVPFMRAPRRALAPIQSRVVRTRNRLRKSSRCCTTRLVSSCRMRVISRAT